MQVKITEGHLRCCQAAEDDSNTNWQGSVYARGATKCPRLDSTRTLAHAIHSRVRTMTSLRSKDTLYVYHIHDWSSPSFSKEMTVYWQSRKHDRQKKVRAYRFPGNIILQLKKLWPLCKLALCLSHVWTPSEGGGPIIGRVCVCLSVCLCFRTFSKWGRVWGKGHLTNSHGSSNTLDSA